MNNPDPSQPSFASPAPFYGPGGHKLTTFIVAKAAGMPDERAYVLAVFAQEPDAAAWMNATAFWNLITAFGTKTRALKNILHSLHGGDPDAVDLRRTQVRNLIEAKLKQGSDWEAGLLIHAFGDTYAHTQSDGSQYGSGVGHLCDWKTPDNIYHDLSKFRSFTKALLDVLQAASGGAQDVVLFNKFHTVLERGRRVGADAEEVVLDFAEYDTGFRAEEYKSVPRDVQRRGIEQFIHDFGVAIGIKYK